MPLMQAMLEGLTCTLPNINNAVQEVFQYLISEQIIASTTEYFCSRACFDKRNSGYKNV